MLSREDVDSVATTMAEGTSTAIRTTNLMKRYGSTLALSGLTLTVRRGEVFGFLGPNGAGKSTAVKMLLGLIHPTSGEGWLLGRPLGDRVTRRKIGYLPELFRYQDWLTAREVLSLHCNLAGVPSSALRTTVEDALDLVGLAERGRHRVGTFSKGMQQRLGLGVALLGDPELVFLDEPTSALDPVGRHDVREIIRALRDRGTCVFLNSHLLSEVEQVCDRVAIIDRGRVIAMGTMAELRGREDAVRIQVQAPDSAFLSLHSFGTVDCEGDWVTIRGLSVDAIPAVVAHLVQAGGRIHAVEPRQESLEDRFLQLLGGTDGSVDNHMPYST